jgi:hypothetical protein
MELELLAEKYALADKQTFFADFVRKKITTVDGILQQSKGKMR